MYLCHYELCVRYWSYLEPAQHVKKKIIGSIGATSMVPSDAGPAARRYQPKTVAVVPVRARRLATVLVPPGERGAAEALEAA